MDCRRDPLLVAVERTLREATQRYEQRPTLEHERADEMASDVPPLVAANALPVVRIGRLVRVPRDALPRRIEEQARAPAS